MSEIHAGELLRSVPRNFMWNNDTRTSQISGSKPESGRGTVVDTRRGPVDAANQG